MRARSLMAVLVLAALLFSVLALSGIYKTGEPRGVGSGGGAELTITTRRETPYVG
jgi:membrane protein involved in colicin uptake